MARRFPVGKSQVIAGIDWLGEEIPYRAVVNGQEVRGDTFPMTWAADGEIYTSAGDPLWGASVWGLDVEKISGFPPDYSISKVNDMPDYIGWGDDGPKPTGMISVKGILYLAYQNLLHRKDPVYGMKSQHGGESMITASSDCGKTWLPDITKTPKPMFPGPRFGGPAFVNFGKDNDGARDEFVYAVSTDQWDNGSHLVLGRVPNDRILEAGAWQWVSEIDEHAGPQWTGDLDRAVAVFSDDRWISLPEMVYLAKVRRYLLLTWRLNGDFSPADGSRLMVYDAPEPWGPFTLVHYEDVWQTKETNPYCPRIPLKWMEGDGITGWLQFSGSWGNFGVNPHYRSHVRKFRLRMR